MAMCFEAVYYPLMPESQFDIELELHRIYQEARRQRNSYFEKLAIVDGGTVALIITAVLGPLHGVIKHKYSLGVGLTFLVLGMLMLLWRNYLAAQFEFYAANRTAKYPLYEEDLNPAIKKERLKLQKSIYHVESTGALLSAIGIGLLLIQVWLILI